MGVKVRFNEKADQFYIYVCHNRQRKAYPTGTKDERVAETLAKEKRKHLARVGIGLPVVTVGLKLGAYLKTWLTDIAAERCKDSSLDSYRHKVENHIIPVLGDVLVTAITKAHCQTLAAHCKKKGLRTASLKHTMAILSAALTDAKVPENPARRKESKGFCKQPNEIKFRINPLTRAETSLFLTAVRSPLVREKGFTRLHPFAFTVFLLLLRTGMRLGELMALQWSAFDFVGHKITIDRSRNKKGLVTSPKGGTRVIDLSDELAAHLQTLVQPTNLDTLVCRTDTDEPYEQRQVQRLFHRMLKRAGLRRVRVHDLRHTFASQLLQDYAPIHYVKDQMGHKSIQMTVDIYGHLIPSVNRGFVNRLTPAVFAPPVAPPVVAEKQRDAA